ncbi:MAG: CoA-binding protein, partial [Gammaproteobacteria bacterium]|nr:CoA-binding protein [Gammaproteobacteria bacterium]
MNTPAVKTTVVVGASPKPDRYANKAIRFLMERGHPVI